MIRIVPVAFSVAGSGVDRIGALFLGRPGPRGLASSVFGMLAYIELSPGDGVLAVEVTVVTALLSVVLHGLSCPDRRRVRAPRCEGWRDRCGRRDSGAGAERPLRHASAPSL